MIKEVVPVVAEQEAPKASETPAVEKAKTASAEAPNKEPNPFDFQSDSPDQPNTSIEKKVVSAGSDVSPSISSIPVISSDKSQTTAISFGSGVDAYWRVGGAVIILLTLGGFITWIAQRQA